MKPTIDWFAGEEGLGLWNIEHDAIRQALPGAATGHSLLIGPAVHDADLLKEMAFGQSWYFDPGKNAGNPWVSNDVSSLPLQDECMDLVILRHCMNTDEKARHLLFETCRVLSPGGHIVISCLNTGGWAGARLRRKQKLQYQESNVDR